MHRDTSHRRGPWAALAVAVALALLGLPLLMGVAQAAADHRVDLRVLVLSNGGSNPEAIAVQLDREGVPYTEVSLTDPGRPAIDAAFLADAATDTAKYQAVVVPNQAGGGLSPAELDALATYERTYGVRQVNAYDWPGPTMGMDWPTASGTFDGGTVTVTDAGRSGPFAYLNGTVPIDDFNPAVSEVFGAFAQPAAAPAAGTTFTPLLTATVGANSGVLAGAYSHDGREELTITAAFNEYMQVFSTIAPGIVDWMTRGIHLGYQRQYFNVQVDDIFLPDSRWSVEGNCTPGDGCVDPNVTTTDIRMTPDDVAKLVNWQNANGFPLDMVFNGGGSDVWNEELNQAKGTDDPLLEAFMAQQAQFTWINHTFTHLFLGCIQLAPTVQGQQWTCANSLDPTGRQDPEIEGTVAPDGIAYASQAQITEQVQDNITFGLSHGLTHFDPHQLVTGEHSGLASEPQMHVDNPYLAPALAALGVNYTASDASREKDGRALSATTVTVPRYPMNIFYNAGTYQDEVDEYNWIYNSRNATPPGGGICDDNPTTSTCIAPLDASSEAAAEASFNGYIKPIEIRNALSKVLTNDPRPFYAHQSNLAEKGILYPVLEGVLQQYRAAYDPSAPLVRLDLKGQSEALTRMSNWRAASSGVDGYIDSTGIHVPSSSTAVPLTVPAGTTGLSLESYGGELSGWLTDGGTAVPPTPMGGYVGTPTATAPDAPTIGTATPGDAQATVTWTAPANTGGSPITGYRVSVSDGSTNPPTTVSVSDANANSATVTGLTNGTPYTFTVAAQNAVGYSAESAVAAATPQSTQPGAPTIGTVTPGNASATVTWTAPTSGGTPTGYTVAAYQGSGTTPVQTIPVADGTATSVVVSGLTNGTAYTFDVTATNTGGDGPASARSAAVTPRTVPGAPTITTVTAGDGQATVAWSPPTDTGGASISGYVVTTYQNGAPVGTQNAGADAGTATLTGLTNGTAYDVTVAASNEAGTGAESGKATATPQAPVVVPGAPTITTTTAGDGQVVVTWTAPTGGDPVTGYTVTAYRNGTVVGTPQDLGADVTTATVTGLTNGTAYTFTVGATNAGGTTTSAMSDPVTPLAAVTVPGAPTIGPATAGDASATVTWTAPSSNGGAAITKYVITTYQDTTSVGTTEVNAPATSGTVSGLTNGTGYTFTVAAVNSSGPGNASAASNEVIPAAAQTTPDAPSFTSVTAGNGQVSLAWGAPSNTGGSPITGYRVTTHQGGTAVGTPLTVDGSTLTATVDGLTNGTAYTFTVAALNTVGWSGESAPSSAVTPTAAPGAPTIGTATAGNASATLTWTPPTDTGGSPLTGFLVRIFTAGNTTTPAKTLTVAASASSTAITGLRNGTSYTFDVIALNSTGQSAPSALSNAVTPAAPTKPGAPGTPVATAGKASASLTWTAPAATGGSPITGYVVSVYRGTGTAVQKTVNVSGTVTTATVTGLTNGTAYTFTVAAKNAVGTGTASARSNSVTPGTVPGKPGIGTATVGIGSAVVKWSAPSNGGSPITGYVVSVYRGTSTTAAWTVPVPVGKQATITGLTNGTAYRFSVAAVNAMGTGATSGRSNSVTPRTVPGTPTIGTATAGTRSATVTWTAPADNGGSTITGYVVRVYRGATLVKTVTTGRNATRTTVSSLTRGVSYVLNVSAKNAAGTGASSGWSNTVTAK